MSVCAYVGKSAQRAAKAVALPVAVYSRAMAVQVPAHITGTVWKIEVKVGDAVASEQTLVILESMKMEMPVEAPQAGRVARILVAEGQAVEEGDVLVELE